MRGFFAALRMTTFSIAPNVWDGLGVDEELSVAHDLLFAVGVA
jgi:hypothetical protein